MNSRSLHPLAWLALALPLLTLGGCATKPPHHPAPAPTAAKSLPLAMVEEDKYGSQFPHHGGLQLVDAHSLLVVEFPAPPGVAAEPLSSDWSSLVGILELLNERAAEWRRINERVVDLNDAAAVRGLQNEAAQAARKAAMLLTDLERLGWDREQTAAVLSGRALGLTNRARTPYLHLAQWATNHWEELRDGAISYQRRVAARSEIMVSVKALRESPSGGSALLHIPGWDNLEPGKYEPLDKTGFRPTEAEQKRLNMERQAASAAAAIINSALTNQAQFKAALDENIKRARAQLRRVAADLTELGQHWDEALAPRILDTLEPLTNSADTETKDAAQDLHTNVFLVNQWMITVKQDVAITRNLLDQFANAGLTGAAELLLGNSSLQGDLVRLLGDVQGLAAFLPSVPRRLADMRRDVEALGPAMKEQVAALLNAELETALRELQAKFPAEAAQLAVLLDIVSQSSDSAASQAVLAAADGQMIPHAADQLVPARLSLPNCGLALGDVVTMSVEATNVVTGETVLSEAYRHEVGFVGFHGRPAVHLIFARAINGPAAATEWQASVAAAVEGHYNIRDPRNGWEKFWNGAYPGLGVHLASLNQGEDSLEFGAGVNITFWRGLLAAGIGYNFSAEQEYVWLGVNLLGALNETKGAFK